MFNWIVRASLGNRLLVLAAAAILMVYGAVTGWRTPPSLTFSGERRISSITWRGRKRSKRSRACACFCSRS